MVQEEVARSINCIEMPEVTGLYVLRLRTHNATIQTTKITVQ